MIPEPPRNPSDHETACGDGPGPVVAAARRARAGADVTRLDLSRLVANYRVGAKGFGLYANEQNVEAGAIAGIEEPRHQAMGAASPESNADTS